MSEQVIYQTKHAKILEVLRSKNFKKSKDPQSHLHFRVRTHNAHEVIVPYQDLKNNFPHSLIDFYEERMKVSKASDQQNEDAQDFKEAIKKSLSTSKNFKAKITKLTQKQAQNQGKIGKQTKIILQTSPENEDEEETIFDYDQLKDSHDYKYFYAVFSENESIENRYLKDLKSEDVNGRRDTSYEGKKKRPKVDQ